MTATTNPPDERLGLYDQAVPWDVRERHLRRYVDAACWVMDYRAGKTPRMWLDAGCGTGYGLDIIRALIWPCAVDGMDTSTGFATPGGIRDILHLGLAAWRWDVISAFEVLEHLEPVNWEAALHAIPEALTSGGCFIGTCPIGHDGPNPLNPHHLFEPTGPTLDAMLRKHFRQHWVRLSVATLTTGERQTSAMFLAVP